MTAAEFIPLPLITRRTQVADAIRAAIISGALKPGTKVTELELAAQFGVSRGPIREAIRELVEEGLLDSRPYAGTQVSAVDERTIMEAYGLRRVLETYAFRLCWERRDSAYRDAFRRRHDALLTALEEQRIDAEIRAEIEFHSTPYEFSGDELLLRTWRQISQRIQLGFAVYQVARGGPNFRKAHERYVELALGDDLAALVREVERHIDLGLETIRDFFRERRVDRSSLRPAHETIETGDHP